MKFRFNSDKNSLLLQERKIGFGQIIEAIESGNILATEIHPNLTKYPRQSVFYVLVEQEVYVVPFVLEDDETIFLKTAFPSRKARKKFFEVKK